MPLSLTLPKLDENLFIPGQSPRCCVFVYSIDEADKLIDYLKNVDAPEPVATHLIHLLDRTASFKAAATSIAEYVVLRNANVSDADLRLKLQRMADALATARTEAEKLPTHSIEKRLMVTALQYCVTSIDKDIEALKQHQDRFYKLYQQNPALAKEMALVRGNA